MTFRSNIKKKITRICVYGFRMKPRKVAKLLNISRATAYRYIKNS